MLSKEEKVLPQCKKCGSELPEGATFCPKCGTAVEVAKVLDLANWGERFVAWLIDVIIIGVAIGVVRGFVWVAWPGYTWIPGVPSWLPFVDFGLGNFVHFFYWTLMEGVYGQSLGKMFLRIRVATLDGGQPDVGRAALESVGKAFLLPIDVIVGWIFYPRKRQRLFSYLSGTVVVRVSR
ncbi:MAG TPA: RDD family protein [Candidatus Acidoferrum sp.]|jgi:uncharacterized RDD family membrane protein YckC|nr:RDD family protein [Candidatus Acidoferrum sp.]